MNKRAHTPIHTHSFGRSDRTGPGSQQRAAAAHSNHTIHHTASHQDLSTDNTHVDCGSYQCHLDLGTKENPVPPSCPTVHPSSALFSTFSIVEPCLVILRISTIYECLAVSQLPIVFGFILKNGVMGRLIGYEKVNFTHQFTDREWSLVVHSVTVPSLDSSLRPTSY
ncbi:hypothetical protein K435DRAFT_859914 [Dendrothele bispora CBS 962.96]|uniref:Uncharacterized protein n=1 Tax=Dendrothele bispora (strain CBS 962.96) TaxID=1314807 RepID=A0A4S8LZ78_DENBC|nr:hypothetical protein K435DRAFT_859914 [Dendrothele bispora CBS 962.96]